MLVPQMAAPLAAIRCEPAVLRPVGHPVPLRDVQHRACAHRVRHCEAAVVSTTKSRREEVITMKALLQYARYALSTLTTIAFGIIPSN